MGAYPERRKNDLAALARAVKVDAGPLGPVATHQAHTVAAGQAHQQAHAQTAGDHSRPLTAMMAARKKPNMNDTQAMTTTHGHQIMGWCLSRHRCRAKPLRVGCR